MKPGIETEGANLGYADDTTPRPRLSGAWTPRKGLQSKVTLLLEGSFGVRYSDS